MTCKMDIENVQWIIRYLFQNTISIVHKTKDQHEYTPMGTAGGACLRPVVPQPLVKVITMRTRLLLSHLGQFIQVLNSLGGGAYPIRHTDYGKQMTQVIDHICKAVVCVCIWEGGGGGGGGGQIVRNYNKPKLL